MDDALMLLTDLAGRFLTDREDIASASRLTSDAAKGGVVGVSALLELARLVGEASQPGSMPAALTFTAVVGPLSALALMVVRCFAAVRADYPSRQDAIAARTRIAADGDALYQHLAPAGADAVNFAASLVGATVLSLSRLAASRAPLVRVETNVSLPSSLLAWQLYGDPARSAELVQRNGVATPLAMPVTFEALAS